MLDQNQSRIAGSCTISFSTMVSPDAPSGTPLKNSLNPGDVCYVLTDSSTTPPTTTNICNGGGSNETGTSTSPVLVANKSFSDASLPENTVTKMRITLTNASINPITNLTISDTLPNALTGSGQLRIATPVNAVTNCNASSTPVITALNTSLALNSGSVPARNGIGGAYGTCYIEVDVVGSAGTYENTAYIGGTITNADGTTGNIVNLATNKAKITYNSSLSATKTFFPAVVSSGGKSTVTVRVANSGTLQISNLSLTDPLPTGMTLANPINASTTCAGTPVITGNPGDNSITMAGVNIAGNGSCDILFDVIATGTSNWTNVIPAGDLKTAEGVQNQEAIVGTLNYGSSTDLTVSKTINPSSLTFPGEIARLTITINSGAAAVSNLSLTDYFTVDGNAISPLTGMAIAPSPSVSTTCVGGIVTAVGGGTSISIAGATLPASSSCTISANVVSNIIGGINNIIPSGAVSTTEGLTNSSLASTSLSTQENIGITKNFLPNSIKPGQRSRLRINFFNAAPQPASNMTVTDILPSGVTIPSGPNPTTTCLGGVVTVLSSNSVKVSGANLAPAVANAPTSCYSEIDVVASNPGTYLNTIDIGELTASVGGTAATNTKPTSDILTVQLPIVINKAISSYTLDVGNPAGFTTGSSTALPGAPVEMKIILNNPNTSSLSGATFTDILPPGLVLAQIPDASTNCTGGILNAIPSTSAISLSGATLGANSSCFVSVKVLSNTSGTYTNTIPANAVTTSEGVSNDNSTSAAITISKPPSIVKEFSPPVIPANGISTMTIYFANDNSSEITLTSKFTDTLATIPGNLVVASTPNVVTTCPGAVTATAGSGLVSYANGAKIPAGGCSIKVDLTASVPGQYINNIPAGGLQTNFGNNQQPANAILTVSPLGFISGKVFNDNDVNPIGIFNPTIDTGIANSVIELRQGKDCLGTLLDSKVTDSAGNYYFTNLAAGTYSVCQIAQPANTINGIPTAGSAGGNASNPTATTSQIISIVLNDLGGGAVSGSNSNNFAEIIPSSISGRVFLDANNNGIQDGSDSGIVGVVIQLLDSTNTVVATQNTTASGDYNFTNLAPGSYSVREPTQPSNTNNGKTIAGVVSNGGTSGTATDVNTLPSLISAIVLPPNTIAAGNNFAEIPRTRSISGTVFLDHDNNGIQDSGDYGLEGETLQLTGIDINGNSVSLITATTNAAGNYIFANLPEGTYTVFQPNQPPNTLNGQTISGSTGGSASNPTSTSSEIKDINLTGINIISAGNNFAEIPGAAPDLTISKTHTPASFGAGSSTGYFTITPQNVGSVSTSGTITIVDTLPTGLTLAAPATGIGWTCIGAVGATTITCTTTDVIASGTTGNPITIRVTADAGTNGMILTNTALISGGGELPGYQGNNTAIDTVSISTSARISGKVWKDINHDRKLDAGEPLVPNWTVELLFNNTLVNTAITDANGAYSFSVAPGSGYQIRFRSPMGYVYGSAKPNEQGITPTSGERDTSLVNNGTNSGNPAGAKMINGVLNNLQILAGDNITEQSLPLDPEGVVYDSITRLPVAGAQVTITGPAGFNPATDLVSGNGTITTGTDGIYQFLLNPSAPSGIYTLAITTYPNGYRPLPSNIIPVCNNTLTVNDTPDPALVQTSDFAPVTSTLIADPSTCPTSTIGFTSGNQATTQYYFSFVLNTSAPISADVLNNHIPLDPVRAGDIIITKTSPLVNVNIGQIVPYTITVFNKSISDYTNINIVDILPAGFKYKSGSATIDGVPIEPVISGRNLSWSNQTLPAKTTKTYKLLLIVGSGVQPGQYPNTVQAIDGYNNTTISNIATATVRVVPDPIFDCSEIIGKVFDDVNANGYQDEGEVGIPNVRLATVNGLLINTDKEGRFHIACATIPDAERGSNFLLKLDERTLPSGYRITTENPRDIRITRGKMVKINFGAVIHKVIRIDLNQEAFEKDKNVLKKEWLEQLVLLSEKMKDHPYIVRIAYNIKSEEDEKFARKRIKEIAAIMKKEWQNKSCCRILMIEEELVKVANKESIRGVK